MKHKNRLINLLYGLALFSTLLSTPSFSKDPPGEKPIGEFQWVNGPYLVSVLTQYQLWILEIHAKQIKVRGQFFHGLPTNIHKFQEHDFAYPFVFVNIGGFVLSNEIWIYNAGTSPSNAGYYGKLKLFKTNAPYAGSVDTAQVKHLRVSSDGKYVYANVSLTFLDGTKKNTVVAYKIANISQNPSLEYKAEPDFVYETSIAGKIVDLRSSPDSKTLYVTEQELIGGIFSPRITVLDGTNLNVLVPSQLLWPSSLDVADADHFSFSNHHGFFSTILSHCTQDPSAYCYLLGAFFSLGSLITNPIPSNPGASAEIAWQEMMEMDLTGRRFALTASENEFTENFDFALYRWLTPGAATPTESCLYNPPKPTQFSHSEAYLYLNDFQTPSSPPEAPNKFEFFATVFDWTANTEQEFATVINADCETVGKVVLKPISDNYTTSYLLLRPTADTFDSVALRGDTFGDAPHLLVHDLNLKTSGAKVTKAAFAVKRKFDFTTLPGVSSEKFLDMHSTQKIENKTATRYGIGN